MEIERKYLLNKLPEFNFDLFKKLEIEQSYISVSPTIRIRKQNSSYFLTVKGSGSMARKEFELKITEAQFIDLSKKVETGVVEKTRYEIPIEHGFIAELDIYKGNLDGLLTVEVEFDTIKEAGGFIPPSWFGIDVTSDSRYSNSSLSRFGIPK